MDPRHLPRVPAARAPDQAALRAVGSRVANYTAGGDGLDYRSDLGTLNLSDVPVAMVELGNMRNPRDAHRMTTRPAGRRTPAPSRTPYATFLG